jgi:hypothetical protein
MVHLSRGAEIVVNNPSQYSWSLGEVTNSGPPEYGATHLSITLSSVVCSEVFYMIMDGSQNISVVAFEMVLEYLIEMKDDKLILW